MHMIMSPRKFLFSAAGIIKFHEGRKMDICKSCIEEQQSRSHKIKRHK